METFLFLWIFFIHWTSLNNNQLTIILIVTELLPESILVYRSPIPGSLDDSPKAKLSCDTMPHLAAYQTAVEIETDSSGMRTHPGQHSRLPCMHTLIFT